MNWIPYVLMARRAKENLPRGSLKFLFVYLKVRIFRCSYRRYIYIHIQYIFIFSMLLHLRIAVLGVPCLSINRLGTCHNGSAFARPPAPPFKPTSYLPFVTIPHYVTNEIVPTLNQGRKRGYSFLGRNH